MTSNSHRPESTDVPAPAPRRRQPVRRTVAALSTAALLTVVAACGSADATDDNGTSSGTSSNASTTSVTATTINTADTHADANDGDYSTDGATSITLADGASAVEGSGATADGDVVTITEAGTYLISGTLSDGQVVVNSTGDGKVLLVLDGVDITSADTSPVVITEADEAVVVLADGSTNNLADSAASATDDEAEDAPNATLFSMADLTIAGSGSLTVQGNSNDGITSKDGLVVLSGTVEVTAVDDGIRGKDYLVVQGGDITVTSKGDGLKSDNEDEGEFGWMLLDAGSLTIAAGDDGIDAIGAINVADGTLTVSESVEGLEAATITIAGGTVDVTSSDDGLNATDGSEAGEAAQEGVLITISGGNVKVAAGADAIDSNGSGIVTGGTTILSTQAGGGGEGSIDTSGTFTTDGGTVVALGGISVSPVADSEQGFVATSLDTTVEAGQQIAVVDADGTVVARYVVDASTSGVVVAADGIENGADYAIMAGDADGQSGFSTEGSADGLTSVGSVTAGDVIEFEGPGGGRGGPPDGERPEGERPQGEPGEFGPPPNSAS